MLGCLIEKQRTTPDAYPLSLNALRLACNQSTNRSPVVDYDEAVIRDALQHTYRRGWTRLTSGHGSRAAKYRHLLDEALGLAPDELALLGRADAARRADARRAEAAQRAAAPLRRPRRRRGDAAAADRQRPRRAAAAPARAEGGALRAAARRRRRRGASAAPSPHRRATARLRRIAALPPDPLTAYPPRPRHRPRSHPPPRPASPSSSARSPSCARSCRRCATSWAREALACFRAALRRHCKISVQTGGFRGLRPQDAARGSTRRHRPDLR